MKYTMRDRLTKFLSLIMVLALLCSAFSACGEANDDNKETTPSVNVGNTPEKPENNDGGESNGEKDNEEEHDFTRVFTLDSLEPLSVEKQAEVEAAWKEKSGEKLLWCGVRLANGKIIAEDRYYGTFNDCVVICHIIPRNFGELGKLEIAGQEMLLGAPFEIWIYSNGELIEIEDAYESQLITADDIAKIAEYHNDFAEYL